MRAALFEAFQQPLQICEVSAPVPHADAAIIRVEACGICRSDWHGWMGHDGDINLPHVPGHELAGVIAEVGSNVKHWQPGARVTVPFSCGCGACAECLCGNQQICDAYTQPGFTQWGAFAEYAEIRHADVNLVLLPESIDSVTAASLGCRFATSCRGVVHQGRATGADTVAVHGCGGVGLSAVMIAAALGARVVAIDIDASRLKLARQCGADVVLNAAECDNVVAAIVETTAGGATLSIDALGSRVTCYNSIACLRKRGRHVQIGLTLGTEADPPVPMSLVIARELEIFGSHGMQAREYSPMLTMIQDGKLKPELLIGETVSLERACGILPDMDRFPGAGVIVIDQF